MSGIMYLNAQRVDSDTSPVAPAPMSSDVPDAGPSPYEALGSVGESGGLGYLFGGEPGEWVPTHLEQTSPAPLVDTSTEEAMKIDNAAQGARPDPEAPTMVAAKSPGGFNFSETLKSGVSALSHLMITDPEVLA